MRDSGKRPQIEASRNLISRVRIAIGLAVWIATAGCHPNVPAHPPSSPIAKSVYQALSTLPATANAHRKTAAVAAWMAANIQPRPSQPAGGALSVLDSQSADPMASAFLFTTMLRSLHVTSRTYIITGVPGFGWYPLVEVLDDDGDHLWDPFTGRYAPDYDGTPLGFTEALTADTIFNATGKPYEGFAADFQVPGFKALAGRPHFVWNDRFASPVAAQVNFEEAADVIDIRKKGDSDVTPEAGKNGEYWPPFAGAGVTSNELGPVVLMHAYRLTGLESGRIYDLRLTVTRGDPSKLLIMTDGTRLQSREVEQGDTLLRFAAAQTEATVNIGTLGATYIQFDAIRWSRE